jgi:two-component system cell cycle sensor histidine kinase/response regulator CckA
MGDDELLASEHRLQMLLACTKGIVFELDRDARYLNAWTHDEQLLAAPRDQLIGKTIREVLGEDGERWHMSIARVYDTGQPEAIHYELDVQSGHRWFVADLVPAPDRVGVVCLVRDVTAHKELEEQLRQAQKMEAIGQLAGGIAHDFNNILTTITGYSELLLDALDDDDPNHRHAIRIRQASERATRLTSQLLDYARRRLLVPEVLDVNAVVANMGRMLRPLIGEHIDVRLALDMRAGGTKADRSGIEQVIMNLAVNARDALGSGGTLTLGTEPVTLDDVQAKHADLTPGRYVVIFASDDGEGMDPATRARIFEPFFTTKRIGKGTGLGLSTVYGIVKQSGGGITVESEVGRGTKFRVYLPSTPLGMTVEPPAQRPARTPDVKTTVLVVEDEPTVRDLVERYLRTAGYDVLVANDPPHALELAEERTIDLLVTDVVMPIMGGDVLAQRLRELQPTVRVLYISGYPDDARTEGVPRVSNSVLLPKPFTPQVLVREVGAMFE